MHATLLPFQWNFDITNGQRNGQNVLDITRLRFIKVLFHTFYYINNRLRKSFVVSSTSLHRGSLNRGSAVSKMLSFVMNVLQKSRLMRSSHNGRSFWESCQISKVYIRSHEIINEPSTSSKHENTVNRMATHLKSNYDTKNNSSGIKLCLKIMITVTWYDFTSVKLHYCVRKRRSSWVIHSDVSSAFRWLLVISPFFHSTKLDWACQTGISELSQGLPQYCIDVKEIT